MQKALIALVITVGLLTACSKSTPKSSDPFEQALQTSAGSGATNCGRLQQQQADLQTASSCVMQAAQAKKPFYVAYDMPGLSVGVAGNSDGKLFAVQSQAGPDGKPAISTEPCPAELRVAQSGRVTCMSMGSMGMGMGGENPHGGMAMPPGGMTMPGGGDNPHGGTAMPPMGTPNPHAGGAAPASDHAKPATKPKP